METKNRIPELRKSMNLSQETLAAILCTLQQAGISVETEAYSDGSTLVADIEKGYRYDLIFLDIEMERVDGINAARQIRRIDRC